MCKATEQIPPPSPSPCGGQKKIVLLNRRKRRVSFGPDIINVFEKDYTRDDHGQIWYNNDEFQAIKNEIYSMIRFANMRQSKALDSGSKVAAEIDKILSQYHWRGLDHIQHKRPRKDIRKRHARDTVHFRKYTHCTDPVQLGIYAANNTRGSSQLARELGLADEREAFEIHGEGSFDETSNKENKGNKQRLIESTEAPKVEPVAGMSICRGEGNRIDATGLLVPIVPHSNGQEEEDPASLSLLMVSSYKMVSMLLPCVC